MKELDVVKQIEQILCDQEIPEAYVNGDLEWIQKRAITWIRSSWRIGVLGVTSSGKSTLINALCGEEILPQEARPSSGVLVSCKKGNTRKAKIIYKDGTYKQFEGKQLTKEVIADYADENYNPGNRKNIDEICLEFPDFLIGYNVEIVDSPGLDAFGLEGHEEIALRQLVPTVDLVLYVTTTKANSEKSNLHALNQIALEHKPVMIAQNFIDCVTQEVTSNGTVRRSILEVENRLRQRVEKILQETDSKSLSKAPVFQVSALEGLKSQGARNAEHWEKSRLQPLLTTLNRICEQMEDQRSGRRLAQLAKQIDSMNERIQADLVSYKQDTNITSGHIDRWGQLKVEINSFIVETNSMLQEVTAKFKAGISEMVSELTAIREKWLLRDAESLSESEIQVEHKVLRGRATQLQAKVFSSVDASYAAEKKMLEILNLTHEDIRSHSRILAQEDKIKIHTETKTKVTTRREKKPNGFLFLKKIGRLITGEDDYETFYDESKIQVINVRKTLEEFQTYVSRFDEQLASYVGNWQADKVKRIRLIQEEVARQNEVIAARTNKPKDAHVLESLLWRLEEVDSVLLGQTMKSSKETAAGIEVSIKEPPVQMLKSIRTSPSQLKYAQALVSLAHRQQRTYAQAMIHLALDRYGYKDGAYDLWFFGRDELWMDHVLDAIFGASPEREVYSDQTKKVKLSQDRLPFINAYLTTKEQIEENFWSKSAAKPFSLIQLDIHQIGVTQGILQSSFISNIPSLMPTVWVVQSVQEYIHDTGLAAAYRSYRQLMEFASISNPVCIVDHENPLFTALFYTADQFSWHAGKGEEQDALSRLFAVFPRLDHAGSRNEAGRFFKEVSLLLRK